MELPGFDVMPTMPNPLPDLTRQVRNALAHLYDYAYLQDHPLAALVDAERSLDHVTRAQRLRRLLLDCIEALRPADQEDAPSDAARAHAILTYRYVDGVPIKEIAARRALGERQAYRELEKGAKAVASILLERVGQAALPKGHEDTPDDPLAAARAEAARLKQNAHPEVVDVQEVLDGVLSLLAPLGERTGIGIHVICAGSLPPVMADRVMLRQALLNLLTHALNAIAEGNLSLTLFPAADSLRIDVEESPTTTRIRPLAPSSGQAAVGPAVARALLEAQGGRLETEDRQGTWHAMVSLPGARPQTVLVVDDNQDLVALIGRYLAGHEVRVVATTNGLEALRLAKELTPNLITLDVMMPGLDGWEILQRLKSAPETADIPVVICSVLHEEELAQTMGASDYITKPVQQAELTEVLSRWLRPLRPAES